MARRKTTRGCKTAYCAKCDIRVLQCLGAWRPARAGDTLPRMATPFDAREPDFERLLHGARIMALRALGDRERAEEIAFDARARVFAAWQSGQILRPELIGAYLCTVARNLIADELRRQLR